MKEFLALAFIFWVPPFLIIMRNVFWDLYLWQIKEFRWDRFWVYLRWDQEETNRSTGLLAIKFILFAMVSVMLSYPLIAMTGVLLSFALWFNQSTLFVHRFIRNQTKRPSFKNVRNILILSILLIGLLSLISAITIPFAVIDREDETAYVRLVDDIVPESTELGDYVYPDVYLYLGFATLVALLVDILSPFFVALGVCITYPFSWARRKMIIARAKKYLKDNNPDLVIVGITGSEGKTTTKELIYELLKDSYKTKRTPKNYNSDVGVARGILEEVTPDTQVFVAEMGAYRKGEIAAATKAFPPEITVVTTLDRQHIGIFGSKQKLFEAKSELVQGMQKDGTAVLNADNPRIRDMDELHTGKSIFVTKDKKLFDKTNKRHDAETFSILIEETSATKHALRFTIKTFEQKETFTVAQAGEHLYMNIALAIGVAHELNIPLKTMKQTLESLDTKLPRLEVVNGDNNTTILNDSYNSSFNGFVAAVNLMNKVHKKLHNGKRLLITKGIYELGTYKKTTYKELLEKITGKFDVLITEDTLLHQAALKDNTNAEIFKVSGTNQMLYAIRKHMAEHDTILLEGRLHPLIIKELISDER